MEISIVDVVEHFDSFGRSQIRVFGRTLNGESKFVDISNIPITIYVAVSNEFQTNLEQLTMLRSTLNTYLIKNPSWCNKQGCPCNNNRGRNVYEPCKKARMNISVAVESASIEWSYRFFGYDKDKRPFAKFCLTSSLFVKPAIKFLKTANVGVVDEVVAGVYGKFKTGVEYFGFWKEIAGYEMIRVPVQQGAVHFDRVEKIVSKLDLDQYTHLYFDIETIGETYNQVLSDQAEYPIGLISLETKHGFKKTLMLRTPLIVDGPRQNTTYFETEVELLNGFKKCFMEQDPDIIMGYNCNGFDFPYILKRAKRLGILNLEYMSRDSRHPMIVVPPYNESYSGNTIDCPGRVILDLLPFIEKANLGLVNYRLSTVLKALGLESKGDIEYFEIFPTFHGSVESRDRLALYCERDVSALPEIVNTLDVFGRHVVKCEILRLRPRDCVNRGVGYHVTNLVLHNTKGEYLFPVREMIKVKVKKKEFEFPVLRPAFKNVKGYEKIWNDVKEGRGYAGAWVSTPVAGFHTSPVGTGDFQSLYPSLAITFGICPTTQLDDPSIDPTAYVSPQGFAFVKESVRRGVFPRIFDYLLGRRAEVRAIPKSSDPKVNRINHATQLELKLCANALYGQLGAATSEVNSFACAISITSEGQRKIKAVKESVESREEFKMYGVLVVYGDTDSLMMLFRNLSTAAEGKAAMNTILHWVNKESGILQGKLYMAFENISLPFLLYEEKKRYVKCIEDSKTGVRSLKISGLQTRAKVEFSNQTIATVFEMAMIQQRSKDEIESFLFECFQKIHDGSVPLNLLVHSARISQPLDAYKKNPPPHVQAARQMEFAGMEVRVGDRIEFLYANLHGHTKDNKMAESVVALKLFGVGNHSIDANQYCEELFDFAEKTSLMFLNGGTIQNQRDRLCGLVNQCLVQQVVLRSAPMTSQHSTAFDSWKSTSSSSNAVESSLVQPKRQKTKQNSSRFVQASLSQYLNKQ